MHAAHTESQSLGTHMNFSQAYRGSLSKNMGWPGSLQVRAGACLCSELLGWSSNSTFSGVQYSCWNGEGGRLITSCRRRSLGCSRHRFHVTSRLQWLSLLACHGHRLGSSKGTRTQAACSTRDKISVCIWDVSADSQVPHQFGLLGKYVLEGAHSREVAGSDRPEFGLPGQAFLDVAGELTAHDADEVTHEKAVLVVANRGPSQFGEIRARDVDGWLEWLPQQK
jgi:hypothetical protein